MISLAIRIPTVPMRRLQAGRLLRALEGSGVDVKALVDPGEGANWNVSRAWAEVETLPEHVTHLMVLEDDAILCRDFVPGVLQFLARFPREAINFFCANTYAFVAANQDPPCHAVSYRVSSGGVAQTLPVDLAREFVRWHPKHCDPKRTLDTRFSEFCEAHGRRVFMPSPSLADHDTTIWSVDGRCRPGKGICAAYALGPRRSALEVDWSQAEVYHAVREDGKGPPREPCWGLDTRAMEEVRAVLRRLWAGLPQGPPLREEQAYEDALVDVWAELGDGSPI